MSAVICTVCGSMTYPCKCAPIIVTNPSYAAYLETTAGKIIAEQKAEIDALAARCAAMTELVSMMEEYVSQPPDEVTIRWHWVDEKLKEVIARCKSPPTPGDKA